MQNSPLVNGLAMAAGAVVTLQFVAARHANAEVTETVTRPNYEVTCRTTKPGSMYIRVGDQVVTRRFAPQEVCSVFRSGTKSVTTTIEQ